MAGRLANVSDKNVQATGIAMKHLRSEGRGELTDNIRKRKKPREICVASLSVIANLELSSQLISAATEVDSREAKPCEGDCQT